MCVCLYVYVCVCIHMCVHTIGKHLAHIPASLQNIVCNILYQMQLTTPTHPHPHTHAHTTTPSLSHEDSRLVCSLNVGHVVAIAINQQNVDKSSRHGNKEAHNKPKHSCREDYDRGRDEDPPVVKVPAERAGDMIPLSMNGRWLLNILFNPFIPHHALQPNLTYFPGTAATGSVSWASQSSGCHSHPPAWRQTG